MTTHRPPIHPADLPDLPGRESRADRQRRADRLARDGIAVVVPGRYGLTPALPTNVLASLLAPRPQAGPTSEPPRRPTLRPVAGMRYRIPCAHCGKFRNWDKPTAPRPVYCKDHQTRASRRTQAV
ncbi:hypothetical protein [Curtobacterium sp. MCPF17_031]|uniref:hypothetical protein n=1 Tax=Curtobacterium sp. MCPF17_031 TaxID=2175653 RepID=UPI0011B761F9|nr:hypothetical protein [Curtobacterium sp. MCPF17_031]